MSKILKIALGLGAVLVLQFSGVDSSVRAADAATNAVATATNAVAGATNAPAPPQTADSLSYPPGANAGNEQDLTWPIPGKTLENMGMTNAPAQLYAKPTMDELIQNVAHDKISL